MVERNTARQGELHTVRGHLYTEQHTAVRARYMSWMYRYGVICDNYDVGGVAGGRVGRYEER